MKNWMKKYIIHGYIGINSVQGSGLLYTIIGVIIIEVFRFAKTPS